MCVCRGVSRDYVPLGHAMNTVAFAVCAGHTTGVFPSMGPRLHVASGSRLLPAPGRHRRRTSLRHLQRLLLLPALHVLDRQRLQLLPGVLERGGRPASHRRGGHLFHHLLFRGRGVALQGDLPVLAEHSALSLSCRLLRGWV